MYRKIYTVNVKKIKTGKYRTVSADETAVSEEQAEESGIYKRKTVLEDLSVM